jgi:2'-5' RNA ligase
VPIYLEDKKLQVYLDALRLIINSSEKRRSHITIRGPLKRLYSLKELERWNTVINGAFISITGVGSFFNHNQNTVFLKCESAALREIWKKSEYGYNPHITLYDGKSKEYANSLLKILNKYRYNITFSVGCLSPLLSIKGQQDFDIKFSINGDLKAISDVLHESIDFSKLDQFTETRKFASINRLCEYISKYSSLAFEQRTGKKRTSHIAIVNP